MIEFYFSLSIHHGKQIRIRIDFPSILSKYNAPKKYHKSSCIKHAASSTI